MTTLFAWLGVALVALAGMVAAMILVGWFLTRQHVASRALMLPVAPEAVWNVLMIIPVRRPGVGI